MTPDYTVEYEIKHLHGVALKHTAKLKNSCDSKTRDKCLKSKYCH